MGSTSPDSEAELLEQVLNPLLDDFQRSFERGFVLLEHCPEGVLSLSLQGNLRQRLLVAVA
ncbi:MAG: DUF2605 family protein, partial [Cyanobium sp. ELA507]